MHFFSKDALWKSLKIEITLAQITLFNRLGKNIGLYIFTNGDTRQEIRVQITCTLYSLRRVLLTLEEVVLRTAKLSQAGHVTKPYFNLHVHPTAQLGKLGSFFEQPLSTP